MSAPPADGYGQYPGQPEQPEQPAQAGFAPQDASVAAPSKKKKRGYAAQAFEVGSGANAAVGGQMQGSGQQYGMPAAQQPVAYGNYPQPDAQHQAPGPGYQYSQAPVQPQQQVSYGYQAPDQGYASAGPQPSGPGVAGITQGMGGMQLGGQPQQQYQQPGQAFTQQPARVGPLNQLYPTDLMNNPFSVSELDLPPPPIVLPANVSLLFPLSYRCVGTNCLTSVGFNQVERNPFSRRQLLATVHSLNPECCANDQLTSQEVQTSFCSRHSAIWGAPR